MLCRGTGSAGTLWPTAPIVRVEDSPSPVYGAALLMRLGLAALRGSNPRSSAGDQALCRVGEVPGSASVIISSEYGTLLTRDGRSGSFHFLCPGLPRDVGGDGGGGGLGQLLGHRGVDIHGERDRASSGSTPGA